LFSSENSRFACITIIPPFTIFAKHLVKKYNMRGGTKTMIIHIIDPQKLEKARGRLIVQEERDVKWQEFSIIVGISHGTISSILNGRTGGSPRTLRKLVTSLRARGISIVEEDFLSPAELADVPSSSSPQL
jgi:transcriptional regulator with XRE-family HTH domain